MSAGISDLTLDAAQSLLASDVWEPQNSVELTGNLDKCFLEVQKWLAAEGQDAANTTFAAYEGPASRGQLAAARRAARRELRLREKQLKRRLAIRLNVPWSIFSFVAGILFPEYRLAFSLISWLVPWLMDRWSENPQELLYLAQAASA